MYSNYFGLTDLPFSIAPDPRFLYPSQQHREALAHLQYGLNCPGGFVLLTGEVGTGKTTVCRSLLEQVPERTDLAFILSPGNSATELLSAICHELKVILPERPDSLKLTNAIYHHLLESHAQGRHTVLIIDEAQNLSVALLEQVRLLTNLETNTHKLLQIMLLGQPELAEKLARPELRQLSQRITARYHLAPLSFHEMRAYIAHRLSVAGIEVQLFNPDSLRRLYRVTGGVPRLINVICDRALLGAFVQRLPRVDAGIINRAAMEVQGTSAPRARRRKAAIAAISLLALVAGLGLTGWQYQGTVSRLFMSLQQAAPSTTDTESNLTAIPAASPEQVPPLQSAEDIQVQTPSFQWPEHLDTELSQVMAYRQLFALWRLEYDPNTHPVVCRYARSQRLDCAQQDGELSTLLAQNHPAVFRLERAGYPPLYATLTGVAGEQANIMLGGKAMQLPLTELAAQWPGSYVMLWQPPPYYQESLQPGSRGEAVAWLEQHLAAWRNRPARTNLPYYDEVLSMDVEAFQRSKGLTPDGIFGPRTGVYFSASLNGLPRLSD
ncbi:ExeA family protein [Oceanimonas doudoroffii]|uniref:Peptidoglycan-binding protein n=1 Tax=Oceanimonas doudoroffii TaxID=84158 RepID=A0A233RB20_9GAMM|nr:ExeA family protein [Oceanimonas doudoroffii]OXY80592.1 peptidoglycan-binding protein [Oceanimonas doudoroffii]